MYPCQCSMMRFASSYGTSILMRRTTSPCSFRSIACRHTCGPSSAPPMLRPDHDVESGAFTTFRPNRCLYHPKIVAIHARNSSSLHGGTLNDALVMYDFT